MSNDDIPYRPISCALYSEYELAIIRRQRLKLVWHTQEQTHISCVIPEDLQTRDHQEFLIAREHTGNVLYIRLDHITAKTIVED
ncbi:MAG: transcriptional antiterminator, Rof [Gammaproteobacteria bacterium]|nr:transcriptional antiterminator, Rof [Gammaproteobacteria bacterium]MDH5650488.1 transcriptional antiterminator, Rof [Gammaproteobacteria bacterium]